MGKQIRLDKYLANMNIGSRSQVKIWIRNGRVEVNSKPCRKPDEKVDIDIDDVAFDGRRIIYEEYIYLMLNKPQGVVSATTDNHDKTVIDLIIDIKRNDLFPVGRLDKDTEGLLLITNDGELAHRLLSPKKRIDKVYYAKVKGKVTNVDKEAFLSGISIGEDKPCLPGKLDILVSDQISEINLTICEGKYHQVKRMFEAIGKEVIYLKRISMGSLILDPFLAQGEYRRLTNDEVEELKNITNIENT